jgi:hypothetical protein
MGEIAIRHAHAARSIADRITSTIKAIPMVRLVWVCERASIHIEVKGIGRSSHGSKGSPLSRNHGDTQTLLRQP